MCNFSKGFSSLAEEISIERLPVRGTIPAWLSGTLLRNGPAQFEVGASCFRHWFDGFAMLHRFSFANGNISYANKFLESKAYAAAKDSGKISYAEFATDPCRSGFRRFQTLFSPRVTDNANVNIGKIADHFVAMTETPLPIMFDPQTLDTLGVVRYDDRLDGHLTTAHPHYDSMRKETVNYLMKLSRTSVYQIYRMPVGTARRELIVAIPVREPSYMHSFALTDHYVILAAYPFTVRPFSLLLSGRPFIENFQWHPERGVRFYIIERATGNVAREIATDAFFAFHHINAFEEGGNIILDIAAYRDTEVIDSLYLDRLTTFRAPEFRRYYLSLRDGTSRYETISDALLELPRINSRYAQKPYRFVYAIGTDMVVPDFLDRLVKIDIENQRVTVWRESSCYPGEPIFVPSPNAAAEDDGVIVSVVLNAERHNSFLLTLDACSFTELARAEVPHHIPFGFHGQYSAESS